MKYRCIRCGKKHKPAWLSEYKLCKPCREHIIEIACGGLKDINYIWEEWP